MSDETAPVVVTLNCVERLQSRGSLKMLCGVTLGIGPIEIEIHGIGILQTADGWRARSPQHKCSDGVSRMSVGLPQEVWNAVMDVLAEQVEEDADPRNRPPWGQAPRYERTLDRSAGSHERIVPQIKMS